MKTDEKVNVTVQLDQDLLEKSDERAKALDLNRSQYFRRLVRADLERNPLPSAQMELKEVAA